MNISTVVKQKFFNGVASEEETLRYLNLIVENFEEVGMVAFGQLKFVAQTEPSTAADYNWKTIDNLANFATRNGLRLHYNTVINNKKSFPGWYWNLGSRDKRRFLENHVRAVVRRYKDKFYLYKLVNESVRGEGENFLGTGESRANVIAQIFKWAKEESPKSLMMINDFGNFYKDDIRRAYAELINEVKSFGGPIDVVGLQGHMWTFELPSDEVVTKTIVQVHRETGLPIHITEFDLSFDNSIYGGPKIDPSAPFVTRNGTRYGNWFDYQAFAYKHFFDICNSLNCVCGLTFWGFCDEEVGWERPGIGLFDESLRPKPAFEALRRVLRRGSPVRKTRPRPVFRTEMQHRMESKLRS